MGAKLASKVVVHRKMAASSACSSQVIDIVHETLQVRSFTKDLHWALVIASSIGPSFFCCVIFNASFGRIQFVIWTSLSLMFLKVSPLQMVRFTVVLWDVL